MQECFAAKIQAPTFLSINTRKMVDSYKKESPRINEGRKLYLDELN